MKKALKAPRLKEAREPLTSADFLSSGSTLLNLALSNKVFGAVAKGWYLYIVGDSSAGKTWLIFTMFAEACRNPAFKDYRLIYDATTEDGAQMDVARFFGQKVVDRLETVRSQTAEEFYFRMDDLLKSGDPFIYGLDSENGLLTEAGNEKFQELKKAHEEGKEAPGSYGMDKAKLHSQNMPRVCAGLRDSGSILIAAGQTRDNTDPRSHEKRTRSGGRALKFYAMYEMWLAVAEKIVRTVRGKPRKIGIISKIDVKKNRSTGNDRTVFVPIYNSFGIDDVGSCVDFLIDEKEWSKKGATIEASDLELSGTREEIIAAIEDQKLEPDLRAIVVEVWKDIESKCSVERKPRYE